MTNAVHGAAHRWMRADFTVRENAMTLGDLVLLWEHPTIELRGELITVSWPARHVTATTWRTEKEERINYLMPIALVTFRVIDL